MQKQMEKSCTMLVHFDRGAPSLANEIKDKLEGNDVPDKIEAMKNAILLLQNGETIPQLFVTIIRYVLPSEDHTIQKLLLLYLEIIDKTDSCGKVLPEVILICQNLRNNLQHPNEYIRGVTLRFLCRLNDTEIVEPLIPSIAANLEHRLPFVRRNAVLAILSIYKLPDGPHILEQAPEIIENLLSTEQDHSCKRNAFLMLFNCAQDRAVSYLFAHIDRINDWGEQLLMVVLEMIRKVCRSNKAGKCKYIEIIVSLLYTPSSAVIYQCAGMLVSFCFAPTAIRAAASTYCQLLLSQSDNNVKLIILDRLNELKSSHSDILVELVMDLFRALSSPNLEIRRKTLNIVLELMTPRNVDEVDNNRSLHFPCTPLPFPEVIKSRYHFHPVTYVKSYVHEWRDEQYCDVCEETRNPKLAVYYCAECEFAAHVSCIVEEVLPSILEEYENDAKSREDLDNNSWLQRIYERIWSVRDQVKRVAAELEKIVARLEPLRTTRAEYIASTSPELNSAESTATAEVSAQ